MTPTGDLAVLLAAVPLWLTVLLRLPVAVFRPESRTLWGFFLLLALSVTTRIDLVDLELYELTGRSGIDTLLRHLAVIAAGALLLRWVVAVVPGRRDGVRDPRYRRVISSRPRKIATWAALVIITATFPLANQAGPHTPDFLYLQAGHLWGSVHLLLVNAYWIFSMTCTAMMCLDAGRRNPSLLLGRGWLRTMAVGAAAGACLGIIRCAYLLIRLTQRPFLGGDVLVEAVSQVCLVLTVLLLILGNSVLYVSRVNSKIDTHAAILELRPMWLHLTRQVPEVLLQDPLPARRRFPWIHDRLAQLQEFWSWGDLEYRLHRRLTEIYDAARELQAYAPREVADRTTALTEELRLPAHTMQAYLLHSAIARRASGGEPCDLQARRSILTIDQEAPPIGKAHRLEPVGAQLLNRATMARLDKRIHRPQWNDGLMETKRDDRRP